MNKNKNRRLDECIKVHDENVKLMREFQKLMSQCAEELDREREAVKSLSDQLEWSLKNEAQYKNAMKKAFEVETVMRKALLSLAESHDLNHKIVVKFAATAIAKADEILNPKDIDPLG